MTWLFLEPLDVWMFRDGRPFDAGNAHRAESLFPPYPTTVLGAIRSHQLVLKDVDVSRPAAVQKAVGDPVDLEKKFGLKDLKWMHGPFLARRENGSLVRYYPQPADSYWEGNTLKPASLQTGLEGVTLPELASPLAHILVPQKTDGKPPYGRCWLSEKEFENYVKGLPAKVTDEKDLFVKEDRVGIGMNDNQQVVNEGFLYEAGFIRPREHVGLLVEMEGYNNKGWEMGVLRLGGESRAAWYKQVNFKPEPKPPAKLPPKFAVFLATPALFEKGWQPENGDWSKILGGKVKPVAVAVKGYESIGGFNWAKPTNGETSKEYYESHKPHRASRRFVPAGSVYYFQLDDPTAQLDTVSSFTQFGAEIGFGQFILSEKEW
jgi:CRISPR-associated protein Cmr3